MRNLLFVAFFATFISVNAQEIKTEKIFGGYKFSQNEKVLTHSQLTELMKNNQEALELMNSAKTNQTWSTILGGIGGGLIGYPIGTAIGGGEPEWTLAAVGAGFIAVAIPIANGYNRKTLKAVNIYNDGLNNTASFQPEFKLNLNGNGVGISMRF